MCVLLSYAYSPFIIKQAYNKSCMSSGVVDFRELLCHGVISSATDVCAFLLPFTFLKSGTSVSLMMAQSLRGRVCVDTYIA